MRIPQELEDLFPEKVLVFERMKELEEQMNNFIKSKLLDVKENLLVAKMEEKERLVIKTTVQAQGQEWALRVEGKLDG